jgi:hypothetical protein
MSGSSNNNAWTLFLYILLQMSVILLYMLKKIMIFCNIKTFLGD